MGLVGVGALGRAGAWLTPFICICSISALDSIWLVSSLRAFFLNASVSTSSHYIILTHPCLYRFMAFFVSFFFSAISA